MVGNFEIRAATEDDHRAIFDLRFMLDVLENQPLQTELSEDDQKPGATILVAHGDGVVVGTARVSPHQGGVYILQRVAVDSRLRGKRAGSSLVNAAEEIAQQNGATSMILYSLESSRTFYERHGYFETPEQDDEGCIRMKKDLAV